MQLCSFRLPLRLLFTSLLILFLSIGLANAQESAALNPVRLLTTRLDFATGSGTSWPAQPAAPASLSAPVDCGVLTPPVAGYEISKGQDPADVADLFGDLTAAGFSVGTVNIGAGPIPPCVDVLIVLDLAQNLALSSPYTTTAGSMLQAWTASGHGLLLASDWGFFKDGTQLLFQAFGYTVLGGNNAVVSDPTDYDIGGPGNTWVFYQADNFANHPALYGIGTLELLRSSWLAPSANAIVTTDADANPPTAPVVTAFVYGTGCVLLSADSNWIMRYDTAYFKKDNARVARQAIKWLNTCTTLSLTKSATPNPVQPGQLLTYTLTATNNYIATLTNVSISDTVPTNTAFVSAAAPHTGPNANGIITWPFGSLGPNASAGVTMVVQVGSGAPNGTVITNTARVTSNEGLTDIAVAIVGVSASGAPTPTPTATQTRSPTPTLTATPTAQIPVTGSPRIYLPLVSRNICPSSGTYRNDFEAPVGSEWSSASTDTTLSGRRFLGQFGNQTVSLTLTCLPAHTSVSLTLDLFIIRSWDGNTTTDPRFGAVGPDVWSLNLKDSPTTWQTTFTNWEIYDFRQAYPSTYPGGDYAPYTGVVEKNSLGYTIKAGNDFIAQDAVYHLSFAFPHSAASLVFNFSASGLQPLADESWGIDNIGVIANR